MSNARNVVTGKVRLSFPHLFEPYAHNQGDEPKYSVMMLIDKKDKATVAAIKKAIDAVYEADADSSSPRLKGVKRDKVRLPLRDGDAELAEGEKTGSEYEGHYFMTVRTNRKPDVRRRDMTQIDDENEVYPGCYARVSLGAYAYNVSGNKGITFGLRNVQFWGDGERLDGGVNAVDEFSVLDDDLDEGLDDSGLGDLI